MKTLIYTKLLDYDAGHTRAVWNLLRNFKNRDEIIGDLAGIGHGFRASKGQGTWPPLNLPRDYKKTTRHFALIVHHHYAGVS